MVRRLLSATKEIFGWLQCLADVRNALRHMMLTTGGLIGPLMVVSLLLLQIDTQILMFLWWPQMGASQLELLGTQTVKGFMVGLTTNVF
jgi:hypothetical protein